MKREHLLLALAWAATLVVAYFVGSSGDSAKATPGTAGTATQQTGGPGSSAGTAAEPREQRSSLRKLDELDDDRANGGKPNVSKLIARARLQLGGGMGGMMNIRAMLKAIAPIADLDDSQLQEALTEVEKTVREPQQKMMFYSLLLGQWAETDGKAALAYADEKLGTQSPFDMGVKSSILGTWARKDPDAAWRWFQTERKDDGNDRSKGMTVSMIFAGMAASDLDGTLQRLGTLDESSRASALQGIAGSASSESARSRLLDRSASLPPEQQAQIRQGVVSQWAMSDSDAAVKWIHSLPADQQKPLRDSAGNMMLMMKPAAGADLLLEGAEDKDKPQIYDRVVGQWAWQDSKAAGEWLSKQPQGPELDNARRTYAVSVAQKDPAAAMDWAKSVQKDDQREQSVGQVFQQWRTKDPAAATAALDASGLPADKIKQLKDTKAPEMKGATSVRYGF